MTWDAIKGKWTQLKSTLRQKWASLSDDQFDVIDGRRERLVTAIQSAYGVTREVAELQVMQFEQECEAWVSAHRAPTTEIRQPTDRWREENQEPLI